MRILVVLALLAVIVWASYKGVASGDETLAAEPGEGGAVAAADVPEPPLEDVPGGGSFVVLPDATPPARTEQKKRTVDPWAIEAVESGPVVDTAGLAGALLHLDPADFTRYLRERAASLPDDRKRLYLAFSEAAAGRLEDASRRAPGLESSSDVDPTEVEMLRAALGIVDGPGRVRDETDVRRAMSMALVDREAAAAARARDWRRAARLYSDLLLAEVGAPWPAGRRAIESWSKALRDVQVSHRFDPKGDWPAVEVEVQDGDSLTAIRKRVLRERPDMQINVGLIEQTNRLGGRYIQPGDQLRVPTDPVSSRVDLEARTVLVLFGDEVAAAYPCGIGREETATIEGTFRIGTKKENPMWFPQGRDPVAFGDPENPLGTRWLEWEDDRGGTHYGFHGTNDPSTIGEAASEGCIRMFNEDVEELYKLLPRGSAVYVHR